MMVGAGKGSASAVEGFMKIVGMVGMGRLDSWACLVYCVDISHQYPFNQQLHNQVNNKYVQPFLSERDSGKGKKIDIRSNQCSE